MNKIPLTLTVLAGMCLADRAFAQLNHEAGEITMSIPAPAGRSPLQTLHRCNPGPWGELSYYYVYLEAPPHAIDLLNVPSEKTIWSLPGKSPEEIRKFLIESGMNPTHVEEAFSVSIPFQSGPDYRIYPSAKHVLALGQIARSLIYAELRRWPENHLHRSPVIIESGDVDEFFAGANLNPELVRTLKSLSYRIGASLAFSDLPVLISFLKDDVEERRLLKSLTRTRSLMLSLKITPGSDFDALKNYWSAGAKNKDILPFFEGVSRSPQIETLDVAHLLPPTPRKYLNTFPAQILGADGVFPDSFWTSMNFFKYLPDESFDDRSYVMSYARQNFTPVDANPRFGDFIVLADPVSKNLLHACIFIADDIVYTKNGRSIFRPFMFMKMDDLMARYSLPQPCRIEVWRQKDRSNRL